MKFDDEYLWKNCCYFESFPTHGVLITYFYYFLSMLWQEYMPKIMESCQLYWHTYHKISHGGELSAKVGIGISLSDWLYWTPVLAQTACRRQQKMLFLIGYLFLAIARESFIRDIHLQCTLKFLKHSLLTLLLEFMVHSRFIRHRKKIFLFPVTRPTIQKSADHNKFYSLFGKIFFFFSWPTTRFILYLPEIWFSSKHFGDMIASKYIKKIIQRSISRCFYFWSDVTQHDPRHGEPCLGNTKTWLIPDNDIENWDCLWMMW